MSWRSGPDEPGAGQSLACGSFSLGRWAALSPGLKWWCLKVVALGNVLNLLAPWLPASSWVAPLLPLAPLRVTMGWSPTMEPHQLVV